MIFLQTIPMVELIFLSQLMITNAAANLNARSHSQTSHRNALPCIQRQITAGNEKARLLGKRECVYSHGRTRPHVHRTAMEKYGSVYGPIHFVKRVSANISMCRFIRFRSYLTFLILVYYTHTGIFTFILT